LLTQRDDGTQDDRSNRYEGVEIQGRDTTQALADTNIEVKRKSVLLG
jgi:hypothetical protein